MANRPEYLLVPSGTVRDLPAAGHLADVRAPGVGLLIGHGPAIALQELPDVLAVGQLHLSPEPGRLLPDEAHVLAHAGGLVLHLKERRQRDPLAGVSAWPAETFR